MPHRLVHPAVINQPNDSTPVPNMTQSGFVAFVQHQILSIPLAVWMIKSGHELKQHHQIQRKYSTKTGGPYGSRSYPTRAYHTKGRYTPDYRCTVHGQGPIPAFPLIAIN